MKTGDRVFVILYGERLNGIISSCENDKYVVKLLDGSKVIVDESAIEVE